MRKRGCIGCGGGTYAVYTRICIYIYIHTYIHISSPEKPPDPAGGESLSSIGLQLNPQERQEIFRPLASGGKFR